MEMNDAQTVTDVYSALAASTASDTEELAIAMSKTASSAEAVGSSFESTSAMLATMISITREAPENLGSALKSIISRYGETANGRGWKRFTPPERACYVKYRIGINTGELQNSQLKGVYLMRYMTDRCETN